MNLSHLHYFVTLADTKNFQEAARQACISQPTLSQAINGLEKELGCQLFVRKKGSVDLTEKGSLFLQYVTTSLKFLNYGIVEVQEKSREQTSEIFMGTIYSAQGKEWSHLIYEFRKRTKSSTRINITQAPTHELITKLKNGTLDIAFLDTAIDDPEIVNLTCWTQRLVLLVNKAHAFAQRTSITFNDLIGHYIITYDLDVQLGQKVAALVNGTPINISYRYKDEITLASIVFANPDVMALASQSWLIDAYRDDVSVIPIDATPEDFRTLFIAYHKSTEQNTAVSLFLDLVRKHT